MCGAENIVDGILAGGIGYGGKGVVLAREQDVSSAQLSPEHGPRRPPETTGSGGTLELYPAGHYLGDLAEQAQSVEGGSEGGVGVACIRVAEAFSGGRVVASKGGVARGGGRVLVLVGAVVVGGSGDDEGGVGVQGGGTIVVGPLGGMEGTSLAETLVVGGGARATATGEGPTTGYGGKGVGAAGSGVEEGCAARTLVEGTRGATPIIAWTTRHWGGD